MGEFGDIYEKTADSLKLKFLNAIISENENLREEFLLFVRSENNGALGLTFENFLEIIKSVSTDYRKSFETVDLEDPDSG